MAKIPSSQIDSIVIHCSATREGQDIKAAEIERWHKERGFKQIGYNYVIDINGEIEIGRPCDIAGAHCSDKGLSDKSYNQHSIGICYVGGLSKDGKTAKDTRTDAQKKSMNQLIYSLMDKYPITDILGHRDASPDKNKDGKISKNEWIKTCPCFDVRSEYPIAVCIAKKK